jgi:hypothetical protein
MNCSLSFEYEFSRDGDDFGWLAARLETPDFTGRNGMWVQWQDVVEFAASLSQYPIEAAYPVTCEWGFGEQGRYTAITKVSVAPAGPTGGLVVHVSLADYHEPESRCQSRFETDYPSLAHFRQQIERMMRKEAASASLSGSEGNGR